VVGGFGLVQTSPNASKAHPHNVFFHLDRSLLMRACIYIITKKIEMLCADLKIINGGFLNVIYMPIKN
jgi:hypothetical protein